jgi:hypothetical protein
MTLSLNPNAEGAIPLRPGLDITAHRRAPQPKDVCAEVPFVNEHAVF